MRSSGMSKMKILVAFAAWALTMPAAGVLFLPYNLPGNLLVEQSANCVVESYRDLGRTSVRKEWKVDFPVRNTGTRRLVLNEVNSDCDCGAGLGRTTIIPPGETRDVTLTLDTRLASGPIEATANFTTSDPALPVLNLTVHAWLVGDGVRKVSTTDRDTDFSVLVRP